MSRRSIAITAGLAAVAVVAVGLLVWPVHLLGGKSAAAGSRPGTSPAPTASSSAALRPGGPVPAAAAVTARQLVSGTPAAQRAALSPEFAKLLPGGAIFPAGSTLKLDSTGWRRDGDFADATGTLTEPGAATTRVDVGFAESSAGSWFVAFEQAAR